MHEKFHGFFANFKVQNVLLVSICSCFISSTGVFFGAVLGPILLVILLNTFLFIPIIYVVIKHSINRLNDRNLLISPKETCKTVAVLLGFMVMLGLTWILSLLTAVSTNSDVDSAFAFQLLFNIFNSTQGFYLFISFVALSSDARQHWNNLICRKCQRTKSVMTDSSNTTSLFSKKRSKQQSKIEDETFTAELFTLENKDTSNSTGEFDEDETEILNESEAEDHILSEKIKENVPPMKKKLREGSFLRRMSSTTSYSKM